MFNIFTRAASFSPPKNSFTCDMPAHKGFRAAATLPSGFELSKTFPTLKEAQIWIMRNRAIARKTAAAFGRRNPAPRAYTIRNLESGKFAPYLWTLVRAEYI